MPGTPVAYPVLVSRPTDPLESGNRDADWSGKGVEYICSVSLTHLLNNFAPCSQMIHDVPPPLRGTQRINCKPEPFHCYVNNFGLMILLRLNWSRNLTH